MKSYRAGEHYGISMTYDRREIESLFCMFCKDENAVFVVNPRSFFRGGDKSGAPRYARARSRMIAHIAADHPGKATDAPAGFNPGSPYSTVTPHPDAVRDGNGKRLQAAKDVPHG